MSEFRYPKPKILTTPRIYARKIALYHSEELIFFFFFVFFFNKIDFSFRRNRSFITTNTSGITFNYFLRGTGEFTFRTVVLDQRSVSGHTNCFPLGVHSKLFFPAFEEEGSSRWYFPYSGYLRFYFWFCRTSYEILIHRQMLLEKQSLYLSLQRL